MEKKLFIKTFGCQMNQYDTNRIKDFVKTIGYCETKNIGGYIQEREDKFRLVSSIS